MDTCTETIYIQSATSLKNRVDRISQIIEALEVRLLDTTGQADVDEYELHDGQMKIKTIYNSFEKMVAGIQGLERLKQKLLNQLNGRNMALRPWQGLR